MRLARTARDVAIDAAHRAQALARLAAQRLHRQRQVKLLAQQLIQVDLVVTVVADLEVVLVHLVLTLGKNGGGSRQIAEVECRRQR